MVIKEEGETPSFLLELIENAYKFEGYKLKK
ncbi:hypothetical protein HBHAL_4786 [Halobacillus halophilus DSM 2266]|uniref:Uncharacterized protein n=1 Tax=Halobacillus halophilus (strain ATCC 35676 / DSM 2266 / JCM 20832 / KCTC 3685 / LMG 17431 / NBRC 102448 / NCIMB 2269) TaxID=866895 RepID=I0JSK2_HALH3|nr:hypothetical protein HBHAL_4786 [Halobacillus halophilus DSM 2266]